MTAASTACGGLVGLEARRFIAARESETPTEEVNTDLIAGVINA